MLSNVLPIIEIFIPNNGIVWPVTKKVAVCTTAGNIDYPARRLKRIRRMKAVKIQKPDYAELLEVEHPSVSAHEVIDP
jgi:hypothetical protein